jgi:hypothetical protein
VRRDEGLKILVQLRFPLSEKIPLKIVERPLAGKVHAGQVAKL